MAEQRTRYRIQTRWFGEPLLVLQVYRPMRSVAIPFEDAPGTVPWIWADAQVEDITEAQGPR